MDNSPGQLIRGTLLNHLLGQIKHDNLRDLVLVQSHINNAVFLEVGSCIITTKKMYSQNRPIML